MSHNLTQPEEIDRILMTMAVYDLETDMPVPDEAPSSKTVLDARLDEFAAASGFSYGNA
jgi:hypothetical protein